MRILFFSLFFVCHHMQAQDTVLLKNDSRLLLNVLHVTNYDVVYTKPNKDRSYFLSFQEVQEIHYRDGSKLNVDSIYKISNKDLAVQVQPRQIHKVSHSLAREKADEVTRKRRKRKILIASLAVAHFLFVGVLGSQL